MVHQMFHSMVIVCQVQTDFPYLGAMATRERLSEVDVKSRIGKTTAAFSRLSKIWNSSTISHKLKIKIFKSIVIYVLMRGSET